MIRLLTTFAADDAIQIYTTEAINHMLANRTNPNSCPPKMTYFNSLTYSNFSMTTDWVSPLKLRG